MGVALNAASRALPKARRRLRGPIVTHSGPAPVCVTDTATEAPETTPWLGWDDESSPAFGLTVSELAGMLVAVAVAGRRVIPAPHTLEGLLFELWVSLWKADPDAARLAFSTAVIDRAPIGTLLDLAEMLSGLGTVHIVRSNNP